MKVKSIKRLIGTILLFSLLFLVVGCGKGEENSQSTEKEEVENEMTEEKGMVKDGKLNLSEMYTVAVYGVNGYTHLQIRPDYESIAKELINYVKDDTYVWQDLEGMMENVAFDFEEIDFYDLSEGDVIKPIWVVDEEKMVELETLVNVELILDEVEYVVEDRPELLEIDPFNDTYTTESGEEISFYEIMTTPDYYDSEEGANITEWELYLKGHPEAHSDYSYGVYFEIDTMGHEGPWKNGDQIKITILDEEYEGEWATELGISLTERTGIVTIDWLMP